MSAASSPSTNRTRAYQIFSAALEREAALRESFLDQECNGDAALRAEIDALITLANSDSPTTALMRMAPPRREEDLTGRIFGRFRLIERIGEGGMGVVYRADRIDGIKQSVAVKLLSSTLALPTRARLEREAQLLARLEHPAVARLIDAGVEENRAWIAMEFVCGERIDEYCMARKLSAVAIVKLLVQLADAVAAAHRMLVVHSDIKPANVLVTGEGVPKLIDFGISTALRDAGAEISATVGTGRLFSPGFAAPEQIDGGQITVATDVFGLGALAYSLLVGRPPHADAPGAVAYLLAVTQRDVELPSRAAAGRNTVEIKQLQGDLDAILCKALERAPARRYASAADMRADMIRFLERRPVVARAASRAYRLRKFVHRNALVVSLTSLLLLSVIAGGLFAGLQAHRAGVARDQARSVTAFLTNDILAAANPLVAGTRDVQLLPLLDGASKTLDQRFAGQPTVLAEVQAAMGTGYAALFETAKAEVLLSAAERGLSAELGDTNSETQSVRNALWYLYTGNIDLEKLYGLSQRMVAAEDAAGRHYSAMAYRGRLTLAWIPCVAAAPVVVGLSNCGELVRRFYNDVRSRFGPEDPTTHEMAWFLGVALVWSAREDEAEPVLRSACDGLQHDYGAVHHRLTECRRYLADALDGNGKYDEAIRILEVVVQSFEKMLGPNSQFTAIANYDLARTLLHAGRSAEAVEVARRTVASMHLSSGSHDTELWRTQLLLADALVQSHRRDEGLALGEQTLAVSVAGLGAAAGPVLQLRELLADAYLHAGEPARAVVIRRENLASGRNLENHPAWLPAQLEESLAEALIAEQDPAEASPLLKDAVAVLSKELGPTNHRTVIANAVWQHL
jgi:eukaryotic-like serine/threonine-protein kinase